MYKGLYLKIILVIIFILIVAVIGYAGLKGFDSNNKLKNLSDTQNGLTTTNNAKTFEIDISNWKDYQSEKYGFVLRYPPPP